MKTIGHLALLVCLAPLLAGCLLTKEMSDVVDGVQKAQVAAIERQRVADGLLVLTEPPTLVQDQTQLATADANAEKTLAFIQARPDDPELTGPLWVQLGNHYLLTNRKNLAKAAFDEARKARTPLPDTAVAFLTLHEQVVWWNAKQSANWGDAEKSRAPVAMTEIADEIDRLEKDNPGSETLYWLHNLHMRIAISLADHILLNPGQSFLNQSDKPDIYQRNKEPAQKAYARFIGFWSKANRFEDAVALRKALKTSCLSTGGNSLAQPRPKAAVEALRTKPGKLRTRESFRWSLQVFCWAEKLQTRNLNNSLILLDGKAEILEADGADWIECSPDVPAKAVVCKPETK